MFPDELDGYNVKKEVADAQVDWIAGIRPWRSFWTLTFREQREQDVCDSYFRRLIWILNKQAFGKNYKNLYSHSYFSYIRAREKQVRGVWHFHVLADKPVNFQFIHDWWGSACGFANIQGVKNVPAGVVYLSKYVRKGGNLDHHIAAAELITPKPKPSWWLS